MFKLKSNNGRVNALLRTGKDMVKNDLSVMAAQHIITSGTEKESDIEGYPINIDDTWYFEGEEIKVEKATPFNPYSKSSRGGKRNE